jgi:hypothetical protein
LFKIVKYAMTAIMVLLFGAVVVGYSWYFERISNEVYSTNIAKKLLMNDAMPGTGDISRDQMEAEILGEMGSDEKKKDESDYTNPALVYTENVGVNNYRAPASLGINQALNVEIGGNTEAMATANQGQASNGGDAATAGQGGSFSSPSQMLADKFGSNSNSLRNKVPGAAGTQKATMGDPTENGTGSQGISQQQVAAQDALNQMPVEKAVYSGYYQVKITAKGGSEYNLNALVKEDGDGNLKITGEYAHTKFSLNGELTQATTDTGTWLVNLKRNRLFQGLVKITITRAVVGYKMAGNTSISTNIVNRKGKTSATIEGAKIADGPPAAPPNLFDNIGAKVAFMAPDQPFDQPTPVATGLASMIAAFSAIAAGMSASKRRNKVGKKGEIMPMSYDDSPTEHEMKTAQFGKEVIPQIDPVEAEPEPPKKVKGEVIKLSRVKKDEEKAEEGNSKQTTNLPAIIEQKDNDPSDGEGANND